MLFHSFDFGLGGIIERQHETGRSRATSPDRLFALNTPVPASHCATRFGV